MRSIGKRLVGAGVAWAAAVGAVLPALGQEVALAERAEASVLEATSPPAFVLGRDLVSALGAADRSALERFLADHLSRRALAERGPAERAAELLRLRPTAGALAAVEASGLPHAAVLNVQDAAGASVDLVIVLSPDEPARADELWAFPAPE